jgi:hypothetical protein
MRSGMRTMTVANHEAMPDIPLMPGGQRVLGHALEFGRDPLALFQRAPYPPRALATQSALATSPRQPADVTAAAPGGA